MATTKTTNSTLLLPNVQSVLERLHELADTRDKVIRQQMLASGADLKSTSSEEKATMLQEVLMPISRDVGRFFYGVARSISAQRIVEFGTSYGVSTIYFAAALCDLGGGLIIGSELERSKVAKATEHLKEAGLSQYVEIRVGDALQTLRDPGGAIDLLFLDGWKDLYLDVLQLLLDKLHPGSVVLADNIEMVQAGVTPYLDYVRNPANGFVSVELAFSNGLEYSVKL
ncbi:MAG: class I SAM-dependent methyltransferase [Brasilonema angustatum HA4187-MV1]|jgi:predicted O-methyltransferase YrrM|nr:class I SAM-dependent methyltransferase [Brasilonema angustatum HA4187-MV1]